MWNRILAGEDNYTYHIASILDIDVDDEDERQLIYAMEFLKHGNLNVSFFFPPPPALLQSRR